MMDKIASFHPVNRQAAMVTARGVHWEPAGLKLSPGQVFSDVPLPTRPWPATARGQDNLTGRIIGRLTVIGLAADSSKSAVGACWVVRCACGNYEHKRTRALRKPVFPARMMCRRCDYVSEMLAGNKPA